MKTILISKEKTNLTEIKTRAPRYFQLLFLLILSFFLINVYDCFGQEMMTVSLEPFTKLSISNSAKVKLTPGTTNSITFEGTEKDAEKIRESVEGGELELKGRPLAKMNITFQKLEDIEVRGIGKVTCTEPIVADQFRIDISGSGEMTLNLIAKRLDVDISGAGNLTLTGSADNFNMDISGAGNVNAEEFKTKVCRADISGSGHCTVDVTDELSSEISGSGSISYKNPPAKINKDISGMGHVGDDDNYSTGGGDTTRLQLGKSHILIVNGNDSVKKSKNNTNKIQPHWAGIEIGFNGYLTPENKLTPKGYDFLELDPWKSIAVNLNFFDYNIKLYKRYIMLVSGFGMSFNNYGFKNNYILTNGDTGVYGIKDTANNYSRNKLTVCYLTLPVLLEFNTNKNNKKSFHVSVGATIAYKIGSYTKQVYREDGVKKKQKNYDEFSTNPWRVDATARIGYRYFNIFANYDLVSLFRTDKGPELHPFTVGLTLVGW